MYVYGQTLGVSLWTMHVWMYFSTPTQLHLTALVLFVLQSLARLIVVLSGCCASLPLTLRVCDNLVGAAHFDQWSVVTSCCLHLHACIHPYGSAASAQQCMLQPCIACKELLQVREVRWHNNTCIRIHLLVSKQQRAWACRDSCRVLRSCVTRPMVFPKPIHTACMAFDTCMIYVWSSCCMQCTVRFSRCVSMMCPL